MYDLEASGEKKGPFLARYLRYVFPNSGLQGFFDTQCANLAKTSLFWIHIGDILPQRRYFSVRGPFWHTSSENLATDECLGML
jgi:hypothetical protein